MDSLYDRKSRETFLDSKACDAIDGANGDISRIGFLSHLAQTHFLMIPETES